MDFFPVDVPIESFITLSTPCPVQLQVCLCLPGPAAQHRPYNLCRVPVLVYTTCIFFLVLSLTSRSQVSHTGLLPFFPHFQRLRMECSCVLRKGSLKIFQLCSVPLSFWTDFQGFLLTNSLKSWQLALLKLSFLIILFACLISLQSLATTAHTVSNPYVTNQFICTEGQQVQHCNPPVNYLTQEVILDTFQEPPGCSVAFPDTFPADVSRVEVPQQEQKPEITMLCRTGGERLCQQALLDPVDPTGLQQILTISLALLPCSLTLTQRFSACLWLLFSDSSSHSYLFLA